MSSKFILNYQRDDVPAIDAKNNKVEKPPKPTDDEKEKLYRKVKKLFDRFVKSQISVFSRNNTIFDLMIRTEEEMALITSYRVKNYNEKLKSVTKFYKKII
jgi:hypothetical protein